MSSGCVSKTVFEGLFPLTAEFRSGPRNPKSSYEQWKESQPFPGGHNVDLQTNVLRFAPENYEYANRYAREYPDLLVLSTWRAASGQPKGATTKGDPLGIAPIEFPGHWVQSLGTTLAFELSASSNTITVSSGANMVKGPALLVETKSNGDRIWDRYEYVLIKDVNGEKLTVEREYNGSPSSRRFPAKSTYISPLPWDGRNREKYTDWFFNLSEHCPLDENKMTAMDVLFREMVEPLKPGNALDQLGGLDLASGPLTVNPENADYDLDGQVDSSSVYRKGVDVFYHRIREAIGFDRILTTSLDYDHLDMINGVNQEGLAYPNDPWEAVSKTVNEVLAWKTLSDLPWASVAFVQNLDKEEDLLYVQMHRLLNGYSACLGLAADVDLEDGLDALARAELFKADENEAHWLGRSMGMQRVAASTPNILNGADSPTDWRAMMGGMKTRRATLEIDGNELVFTPTKKGSGFPSLQLNFPLRRKSDFTVFFEAKSEDKELDERRIYLPRVNVDVDTEPVRAFVTNRDYIPVSFYVRGAEGSDEVTIDFRFDYGGGGPVRFRSMSVHAAPDTLACEFEGGVVLVNPSLEESTFDLEELFGKERTGFRRLLIEKPFGDVAQKYLPQVDQALEMNNGYGIDDVRSVEVGQRNALFLIADNVDAPGSGRGKDTPRGGGDYDAPGSETGGNDAPDDETGGNDAPDSYTGNDVPDDETGGNDAPDDETRGNDAPDSYTGNDAPDDAAGGNDAPDSETGDDAPDDETGGNDAPDEETRGDDAPDLETGGNEEDLTGTCGDGNFGDGVCPDGSCCSEWGWCGNTEAHCGSRQKPCGRGVVGNGFCEDGSCCSVWGWCGWSASHCQSN